MLCVIISKVTKLYKGVLYIMAFDGIVCKAIVSELNTLSGARMDKVFQPDKNTIVLGFYLNGVNYALNCCINSRILQNKSYN